jgi:lipoprotein-releasing system permease protein
LHFLFAWRYFKAKKSTTAINIIAWISIGAIILGTAALILVLSVFNGFEGLVKSLYSSFYPDLRISAASGKVITVTQEQLDQLHGIKSIKNFSKVIEEKGFLQTKTREFGGEDEDELENQIVLYLKGVDENYRYVSGVSDNLRKGDYDLGDSEAPRVILGSGIEGSLGINGANKIDPLIIYLPRKDDTEMIDPTRSITSDTVRVSAIFQIQQDFDNKYGITNIEFLRAALQMPPDKYSFIEIAAIDPSDVDDTKKEVQKIFGDGYLVQNRYEQNQSLYSVMNMERWAIYGILSLILVVAAFNMIGALTMLVLEKQKDISVLHALGANRSFIQKVFLSEGVLIAFVGGSIGMLLALLIVWLQLQFHLVPLGGGSFLIDYFPVKLRLMDFLLVGATVFVIAIIASWLPSRKAARQSFSLRSE